MTQIEKASESPVEAIRHQAAKLNRTGQWQTAYDVLSRILAPDPKQSLLPLEEAHLLTERGLSLRMLGRYDEAASNFKKAVALSHKEQNPEAELFGLVGLLDLARTQGETQDVISFDSERAYRTRAAELITQLPPENLARNKALLEFGLAESAVKIDPEGNHTKQACRYLFLAQMGLTARLHQNPDDVVAMDMLGRVYQVRGGAELKRQRIPEEQDKIQPRLAPSLFERAYEIHRALNSRRGMSNAAGSLGNYYYDLGTDTTDAAQSTNHYLESLIWYELAYAATVDKRTGFYDKEQSVIFINRIQEIGTLLKENITRPEYAPDNLYSSETTIYRLFLRNPAVYLTAYENLPDALRFITAIRERAAAVYFAQGIVTKTSDIPSAEHCLREAYFAYRDLGYVANQIATALHLVDIYTQLSVDPTGEKVAAMYKHATYYLEIAALLAKELPEQKETLLTEIDRKRTALTAL